MSEVRKIPMTEQKAEGYADGTYLYGAAGSLYVSENDQRFAVADDDTSLQYVRYPYVEGDVQQSGWCLA
jgi:hypothetical protein